MSLLPLLPAPYIYISYLSELISSYNLYQSFTVSKTLRIYWGLFVKLNNSLFENILRDISSSILLYILEIMLKKSSYSFTESL